MLAGRKVGCINNLGCGLITFQIRMTQQLNQLIFRTCLTNIQNSQGPGNSELISMSPLSSFEFPCLELVKWDLDIIKRTAK